MKKLKKILAVAVASVMMFAGTIGMVAKEVTVYAASEEKSGTCGANAVWMLGDDGTVTISGTGDVDDVYVPDGYWETVKKAVIQEGITGLYDSFPGCKNLTEAVLPNSVIVIGYRAFKSCQKLLKIVMPDSVKRIGKSAFVDCKSLSDVSFSNNLITIEYGAFRGCSSLPEVIIPNSVTEIGEQAFAECSNLRNIQLSNNVTKIAYETFYSCSSLQEVTIPYNVESLEYKAFGNCSSLTAINFEGDAPKFADDAFENVTATVSYPIENTTWTEDKKQNYGGNLTWSSYSLADRLAIVPELTDSVYVIGSGTSATIKCTGIFKYFVDVAVDGKTLDSSFYTAESGSTILTILSTYLDTLSEGDHVVTLNYTYGSVDTVLKVIEKNESDRTASVVENPKTPVNAAPATGDLSNVPLWIFAGTIAAIGGILVFTRKRKSVC